MLRKTLVTNALRRFIGCEDGSMTIWGLFLFLSMAILSGLAIDIARLQTTTVQMQNAADSAAHAALITRRTSSASIATERAIAIAQGHMTSSRYGTALASADVQFGVWSSTNRTFTPDPNAGDAVRVTVRQTEASGNPFSTSLLQLIGVTQWDAVRTAVFANRTSACQRQGIISHDAMRFDSLNRFYQPVCLHSNTSFEIAIGNKSDAGVGVSVPDLSKVKADLNANPDFNAALSYRTMDVMSMVNQIPSIIAGLTTPGSPYIPSYITNQTVVDIPTSAIVKDAVNGHIYEIKADTLTPGRIHRATCNGLKNSPKTVLIRPRILLSRVVIVTNCLVQFEMGVRLEDAVVATSDGSSNSISGSAGVVLGRNDKDCASGGGAQLVTNGAMIFNAALSIYGSQLLAAKDIHIDAQANGTMGVAVVAGGKFTATSLATWQACPETSKENTYQSGRPVASLVQ